MIAKHCPVKPKVKPIFNRPPLNMLGDNEHVQSAHEHEHFPGKPERKPVFNRAPLNMLGDTLDERKGLSGEAQSETRF